MYKHCDTTYRDVSHGDKMYGDETYRDVTYGDVMYGDIKYGDITYGDVTYEDIMYGDVTYGDVLSLYPFFSLGIVRFFKASFLIALCILTLFYTPLKKTFIHLRGFRQTLPKIFHRTL